MKARKLSTILLIALMITSISIVLAVPQMPHRFYGNVALDGAPAPDGTLIEARDNEGVTYKETTTIDGQYGWVTMFKVPADDPDTLDVDGFVSGESVYFYVNDIYTDSYVFDNGEVTQLDLGSSTPPDNLDPEADAGDPYTVQVDVSLTFDGTGSTDSDGTVESFAWDFGDEESGTGATPSHTYTVADIYTVTLTVTDDDGATDSDTTTVTVLELIETGILSVDTTPIKGEVFVNEEPWGTAPQEQIVDVGTYEVSFGAVSGYVTPDTISATVVADTTKEVTGKYTRVLESELTIDSILTTDYVERDWGDYADTMVVQGSGVTAGADIEIGWDGLKSWDGERGIMNSTTGDPDGSFEVWFDVPEALNGLHYIWVRDKDTGETYKWDEDFNVEARLKLSPSSGLEDDKITLYGYGYSEEEDIVTVTFDGVELKITPSVPETNDLGSWDATFKVPELTEYKEYPVIATDAKGITDSADFRFGANIVIDPDEGPVGTVVEIEGTGFTEGEVFDGTEVKINNIVCYITKEDTVGSDGEFKIEVVIPQTDDEDLDDYDIIVTEDDEWNDETADEEFEVTGLAEIELDPEFGVQGTRVTIEGWNFTQISGEEIEIWLCDYTTKEELYEITDDLETESNGEFEDVFGVPAKSSAQYKIKAKQADYNIQAFASFRIGLMIVISTPSSGPTGTLVTLSGTGFTDFEDWNATFGDYIIVEDEDGDVNGDSDLILDGEVPTFYVPTVEPGTYIISVLDIDSDIAVDVEWTVTATTMVEFDPENAPNEYNMTISGSYFNALEEGDLEFVLYNVTAKGEADEEWDIDVLIGDPGDAVELDDDGNFTGWWLVLEDEDLSLGDYILNVTAEDADNIMAQGYFTVVEKSIIVDTRKTKFARGESVAFDITSSFAQHESYIEIYDPVSDLYWTTDLFTDGSGDPPTEDMWLKVGEIQTVPYYYQTAGGNQLFLLEDAQLGTWSWEWYDDDDDELDSGTFEVTEAGEDVLSTQLTELSSDLADIATDFTSVSTDVSDLASGVSALSESVAQAIAAANAANEAVSDVAAAVASVADTAVNAADAATSAATAAASAKEAADSAGAAASRLTNLVYGAIVASLVAAIAAIVSLMQISKKIA